MLRERVVSSIGLIMLLFMSFLALHGYHVSVSAPVSGGKTVYLTFDDGPSAVTEAVLDILRESDVQATFFVVGATTERGVLVYKRIIEEGHSLGLHTYSHEPQRVYRSLEAFVEDFERLRLWLAEATGFSPRVCRMAGGSNTAYCPAIVKEQVLTYLVDNGYACFDWDVDPKDSASYTLSAKQLARNVITASRQKPDQDLVILLHDDALRTSLPDALREVIGYFRAEGYAFGILREDTESVKRILPSKYRG